jgi:pentatricopeptide repeat protein
MKQRFQAHFGEAAVLSPFSYFWQFSITSPSYPTHQRNFVAASNQLTKPVKRTSNLPSQKSTSEPPNRWKKRQEWLDSRGVRPAHKPVKKEGDQDFALRKQLQYLKDPLKLAEHVRRCLREGDASGTLAIVRFASKSVQCTVSWNHLIEWHLAQGKLRAALRLYNEVCRINPY